MAGKRLKYLLKTQTLLWLGSAALPCALFLLWRGTTAWIWCALAVVYACAWAVVYRHTLKEYAWTYISIWILALFSLSHTEVTFSEIALSLFWAGILFVFFGVVQVRFHQPHIQLGACYFLIIFSAAGLYAFTNPSEHMFGATLLMLIFLYTTGIEYVQAQIGISHRRIRLYVCVISVCVAEVIWIGSLLSIGYLNIASLALVLYMVSMTIMMRHIQGTLTARTVLKDIGFLVGFSAVILLLSNYAQ